MKTTYKVSNSLNTCVVTEYWDDIPVKRYQYSCHYHGGDIVEFMDNNILKMISKCDNIENIINYLEGGI